MPSCVCYRPDMGNPASRAALTYVLLFGAGGVSLPFAALWFRSVGLSPSQIGLMLATPMLGRVLVGPLLAVWADGFQLRRTPIALLGVAMAVGYGGAALLDPFPARLICWFVGASAASGMLPLVDVLTLRLAARDGFSFSLPRGCGSLAFVAANVGVGALLLGTPADVVVWWLVGCGLAIVIAASLILPPARVSEDEVVALRWFRFSGMVELVRDRTFMLTIIAVGLVQGAHAFQYGFSALLWRAQGISEAVTGQLWAFGVVVEIALMWWIEPWRRRRRISPWTMLLLGSAAAVLRWGLMALAPPLWALWPLQALHALTFAATFLAGLQIIERMVEPARQTAAQTLSSALSSGLLIGLATLASGLLYDRFAAGGYLAMAGMAAAGFGLAMILRRPAELGDRAPG